ncbi:YwdI family protein [Metabacillus arenae]|uniref:YwdI family protein n=1 Tax=Metabacillus arenae TaxID=2771434 RepID=A0A926RVI5_9BACI|nr:YwdI family protein [Metabacillus arenae]MBD1379728.1 YwdI family protein [Metabacillus arenae]
MNIHISALIHKMEKEIGEAKKAGDEQLIRMHIQVVQSLCEVILEQQSSEHQPAIQPKKETNPLVDQWELQKMMGSAPSKKQSSSSKESDANGDSIFDF